MFVKQVSVFLENSKGSLAALTQVLGQAGIDMIALSIADTEDFGILRCIASDTDAAVMALRKAGYTAKVTDVLAVAIADEPGGLGQALSLFDERGISVEYLYSFLRRMDGRALIILRPDHDHKEAAAQAILDSGNELLSEEQVRTL